MPIVNLRAVVAGSWLVSVAFAAAAQAPSDPSAATGFVKVGIDLPSRTFDALLPFDVPFLVQGQVPPGIDRIELQYQESRVRFPARPARTDAVPDDLPCLARPCEELDTGVWKPATPIRWDASGLTEANANFALLVREPLEADRYYRFRFFFDKKLTDEQAAAFKVQARAAIDAGLRDVARGDFTEAAAEALRGRLVGRLKCAAESCAIRSSGRLFDPLGPGEGVRREWLGALQRLVDPQVRRAQLLRSYAAGQLMLKQRLDQIQSNKALAGAVAALRARARDDPSVQEYVTQYAAALALAVPESPDAASRVARCLDGSPRPELSATWEPAAAEACAMSYRATQAELGQLAEVLAQQLRSRDLVPADRQALEALAAEDGPLAQAHDVADQLESVAHSVGVQLQGRELLLDEVSAYAHAMAQDTLLLDASTTGGESTIRNNYVSADAGFVYAFTIGAFVPYLGTNIYFRPVNKAAPLSQRGGFGRRFALTFGVTLASIEDKEPGDPAATGRTRTDLFGNQSMLMGAGLRVTQSVRLGGGALVFLRKSTNPLVRDTTVGVVPYVSISFDIDVARSFAGLGKIFSGG